MCRRYIYNTRAVRIRLDFKFNVVCFYFYFKLYYKLLWIPKANQSLSEHLKLDFSMPFISILKTYKALKPQSNCDSENIREELELHSVDGEKCSRECSAKRHKIFNEHAEYLPALSSRLQVLYRFSYLLNKISSVYFVWFFWMETDNLRCFLC